MTTSAPFTGREWVLAAVARWLDGGEGRHFLLTGEPGSGKSTIAHHLADISTGAAPATQGTPRAGAFSATHFCSARDGVSIDARAFSHAVARQLATAVPPYALALQKAAAGDRTINISVEQWVEQARSVVGVQIELRGADPQQTFNRLVAEPLQDAYAAGFAAPVTLLVDGLDEALAADGVTIVRLLARSAGLPPQVRFVLTSRRDARVLSDLGVEEGLFLSAPENEAQNREDVERFAVARVDAEPALRLALGNGAAKDFARRVARSADGNFQYADFLLTEVAAGRRAAGALDGLPAGLDALYLESLARVVGNDGWAVRYRPVMGTLSVARDPVSDEQLAAFSGLKESEMWDAVRDLQQFLEEGRKDGKPAYRLYHQSVVDFLQARRVGPAQLSNPFYVVTAEAHAAVADACLACAGDWDACDDYALRHAPAHLAGAAESPRAGRNDPAALVSLVLDPGFQGAYVRRFDDPVGLEAELKRAVSVASLATPPAGAALVVDAALGVQEFAEAHLRPEPLFALARAGSLEAAERRLASLRADADWRGAAILALAWTAGRAAPDEARARLDQAQAGRSPLQVLHDRIRSDLDGAPWTPQPLPVPPTEMEMAAILDRIGGGSHATGIEARSVESGISGDQAPAYLAEVDGPPLVAYAAAHGPEGDEAFRRYLSIHAGNAYAYYRNRSLWALLEPVLRHPDPTWAREMVQEILVVALAPGDRTAFKEALPLAVAAASARAGDAASLRALHEWRETAQAEAANFHPGPRAGDPWAHRLRRLGSLAEVYALVLDDSATADGLVDHMLALSFGFAGFRYRACLEGADSAFLARRAVSAPAVEATSNARTAAHNIQDYAFCARATARVNGLEALAWPPAAAADRFAEHPDAPEFAAWHRVSEGFAFRADDPTKLKIPGWARRAATPAQLAKLFRVGVDEVLTLNPGSGSTGDQVLPPGTRVNLPDPSFTPMVAARMAAGSLGDPAVPPVQRVRAIMRLVPHSLADRQSLDAVLARLVIATRPLGDELRRMQDAVARSQGEVVFRGNAWAGPFFKDGIRSVKQSVPFSGAARISRMPPQP